jgi:drug/metabolite transporter, DME family
MGATAGVIWSLGALTNRLARHVDAFQYLVWRSIGVVVVLELIARITRKPSPFVQALTSGWVMVIGSAGLLGASLGFVYAIKNTSAANAAFLSSMTPFVAAVLGWIALRESIRPVTVVAMFIGVIGLLVMVLGDLGAGTFRGNAAAVMSSLGFGIYMVSIRARPTLPWVAAMPGYAIPMIVLCGAVTLGHRRTLLPPTADFLLPLLHGAVFIVCGTLLFNAASQSVPPVGMALLAQTETIAVPLLIAAWFGEWPTAQSLIGALIILVSLILNAVGTSHVRRLHLDLAQ